MIKLAAADIIGMVMAGILSLFWLDLRRLRRTKQEEEIKKLQDDAKLKDCMFRIFLTKEAHDERCARTYSDIKGLLTDVKLEILHEIRNGRNGTGK
jgi:hypothetical protein